MGAERKISVSATNHALPTLRKTTSSRSEPARRSSFSTGDQKKFPSLQQVRPDSRTRAVSFGSYSAPTRDDATPQVTRTNSMPAPAMSTSPPPAPRAARSQSEADAGAPPMNENALNAGSRLAEEHESLQMKQANDQVRRAESGSPITVNNGEEEVPVEARRRLAGRRRLANMRRRRRTLMDRLHRG